MELSGGLVLGLEPVGRKSGAVVHCHSEWPLRVQCDGQSRAAHTGSLYQGFLDSVSIFFCLSHTMSYTHTFSHTCLFFFSFYPRDHDVANVASAVRPDIVITNSR